MTAQYPCPCCGHLIFLEPPGSYDICEICFWEDDIVMLRWPTTGGGANHVALVEAQRNYAEFGSSERAHRVHVRPATDEDPIDPVGARSTSSATASSPKACRRSRGPRTPRCSTGGGRRSGAATASSGRRRDRGCGRATRAGSR